MKPDSNGATLLGSDDEIYSSERPGAQSSNQNGDVILFKRSDRKKNSEPRKRLSDTVDKRLNRRGHSRRLFKTALLIIALLGLGSSIALPGPTLLDLEARTGSTTDQMSYLFAGRSLGYFAGSLIGGILFDRLNHMLLMGFALLLIGTATLFVPWSPSLLVVVVLLGFQGCSMGILDTSCNAYCLRLWGRDSEPYLQAMHFGFAFGAFLAPLIAEPFLSVAPSNVVAIPSSEIINNSILFAPSANPAVNNNIRKKRAAGNDGFQSDGYFADYRDPTKSFPQQSQMYEDSRPSIAITAPPSHQPQPRTIQRERVTHPRPILRNNGNRQGVAPSLTAELPLEPIASILTTSTAIPIYEGLNVNLPSSQMPPGSSSTSPPSPLLPSTTTDSNIASPSSETATTITTTTTTTTTTTPPVSSTSLPTSTSPTPGANTTTPVHRKPSVNDGAQLPDKSAGAADGSKSESMIKKETLAKGGSDVAPEKPPAPPEQPPSSTTTSSTSTTSVSIKVANVSISNSSLEVGGTNATIGSLAGAPNNESSPQPVMATDLVATTQTAIEASSLPPVELTIEQSTTPASTTTSTTTTTTSATTTTTSTTTTTAETVASSHLAPVPPPVADTKATSVVTPKVDLTTASAAATTTTVSTTSTTTTMPLHVSSSNVGSVTSSPAGVSRIQVAYLIISILLDIIAAVFIVVGISERVRLPCISRIASVDIAAESGHYKTVPTSERSVEDITEFKASDGEVTTRQGRGCPSGFQIQLLVLLFIFYMLYVGGEVTFGQFVSAYAERAQGWSRQDAAYVASAFWGALAFGRAVGIPLSRYLRPASIIAIDLTLLTVAMLGMLLGVQSFDTALWLCAAVAGAGMSSIFASGYSWTERYIKITGKISSILIAGSSLGEMIVPVLAGFLFVRNPQSLAYLMAALSFFMAVLFVLLQNLALNGQDGYAHDSKRTGYNPDDGGDEEAQGFEDHHHEAIRLLPVDNNGNVDREAVARESRRGASTSSRSSSRGREGAGVGSSKAALSEIFDNRGGRNKNMASNGSAVLIGDDGDDEEANENFYDAFPVIQDTTNARLGVRGGNVEEEETEMLLMDRRNMASEFNKAVVRRNGGNSSSSNFANRSRVDMFGGSGSSSTHGSNNKLLAIERDDDRQNLLL